MKTISRSRRRDDHQLTLDFSAPVPRRETPEQMRSRVLEKVDALLQIARRTWGDRVGFPIKVMFDLRGLKAGTASRKYPEINLNLVLMVENTDHFIEVTVTHEVAHIIVNRLYKRRAKPHGREWKMVMMTLGIDDPARCHTYDTTNSRQRLGAKYVYVCDCRKDIRVGIVRHRKIQGGIKYHCTKCKANLVFTGRQLEKVR